MKFSVRRIGSAYGAVIDGVVRSNLFSNPFEFKLLGEWDLEAVELIRTAVFKHFIGMFSIKNTTRKLGFPRLFYKFGSETKQLGLLDGSILVVTLPHGAPDLALDINQIVQAKKDATLCENVLKNRDVISRVIIPALIV